LLLLSARHFNGYLRNQAEITCSLLKEGFYNSVAVSGALVVCDLPQFMSLVDPIHQSDIES
jgi:hypothetical protein